MKVCHIPQDFSGPGMYRLIFPLKTCEEQGLIEWQTTPYYETFGTTDDSTLYKIEVGPLCLTPPQPEADVFIVQMPLDADMLHVVKHLKSQGKVVVGECDDSDKSLPEFNPAYEGTSVGANPARNREWRRRIFQACDMMTVSTPALAREWASYHKQIRVLPNFLLWGMWQNVRPQYEVTRPDGRVRIGWMGRLHWRRGDVEILREVIPPLLERHPHVDVVAAGDGEVHDLLSVPEDRRVTYQPVSFPLGMSDLTASMDVGLVPLALIPFNDAKSHLKGMEYAACGIPCVASASESYREYVQPGVNGFVVETAEEWSAALDVLVTDHELRRRMGRQARELVKAEHTIDRHAHLWADAYQEMVDLKARRRGGLKVAA